MDSNTIKSLQEAYNNVVEQTSTVASPGGAGGKVTVDKQYPATLGGKKGVKSTGPTGTEYFTPNFPDSNVPNRAEAKFKSVASQQYEKIPSDQRTMDLNKPVSVTDRTKYDPSYKPPGMKKENYQPDSPAAPAKPQLSQRAQAILSGNSPLSRDSRARGGFDPRFDKKPSAPSAPSTPSSAPKPTSPTPQTSDSPKPSPQQKPGGGILGSLDKFARDTAGKVGETIGREKASKVPGANIPGLGDIIKGEGGRRGRNQGQQMYDKAKETIGGLLKQEYEPDAFDIVLEYLVTEGYADTNKAAIAIMANMSEEWRQSIVEAEVLSMRGGVPGSVKVKPALSIPGTDIGIGPNKPVPGTFTTTTPGQKEKIKQGDTHIDTGAGGMKSREGAGPTGAERQRYNAELTRQGKHTATRMSQ